MECSYYTEEKKHWYVKAWLKFFASLTWCVFETLSLRWLPPQKNCWIWRRAAFIMNAHVLNVIISAIFFNFIFFFFRVLIDYYYAFLKQSVALIWFFVWNPKWNFFFSGFKVLHAVIIIYCYYYFFCKIKVLHFNQIFFFIVSNNDSYFCFYDLLN